MATKPERHYARQRSSIPMASPDSRTGTRSTRLDDQVPQGYGWQLIGSTSSPGDLISTGAPACVALGVPGDPYLKPG